MPTETPTPEGEDAHALRRTSPKGELFIGTCMKCGKSGLRLGQLYERCANPGGMTQGETLLAAIEGDES